MICRETRPLNGIIKELEQRGEKSFQGIGIPWLKALNSEHGIRVLESPKRVERLARIQQNMVNDMYNEPLHISVCMFLRDLLDHSVSDGEVIRLHNRYARALNDNFGILYPEFVQYLKQREILETYLSVPDEIIEEWGSLWNQMETINALYDQMQRQLVDENFERWDNEND